MLWELNVMVHNRETNQSIHLFAELRGMTGHTMKQLMGYQDT